MFAIPELFFVLGQLPPDLVTGHIDRCVEIVGILLPHKGMLVVRPDHHLDAELQRFMIQYHVYAFDPIVKSCEFAGLILGVLFHGIRDLDMSPGHGKLHENLLAYRFFWILIFCS
jgi:hypothetical protein